MQTAGPVIGDGRSGVEQPIRAAELVAALSIATDLGTGQPLEHAVRTAVLRSASASSPARRRRSSPTPITSRCCTRRAARRTGTRPRSCSATTSRTGRPSTSSIRPTPPRCSSSIAPTSGSAGPRRSARRWSRRRSSSAAPRAREAFATMCEVAQRFAGWLGLRPSIEEALEYVFARWDGRGLPAVAGDAIPLPMRLLHVARDASLFLSAAGVGEGARGHREPLRRGLRAAARRARRRRTSTRCSPSSTRRGCGRSRSTASRLRRSGSPASGSTPRSATIAAITGLKSPWLREHSTGVAELAEAAAWRMGLPSDSVTPRAPRRARARPRPRRRARTRSGRSPGRSAFGEWERVRLHAHYTERAFAQSPTLAPIGRLAGSHHERLDGSGYHRGSRGPDLDQSARILAAADCYVGDARGAAVQAGARRGGGGDRAPARGEGGTARRRGRRRGPRRRRPPRRQAAARAPGRA